MSIHRSLDLVASAAEVATTHEALMDALRELDAIKDPDRAADCVRRIKLTLPGHLAYEEAPDGIFDWVLALAPELGDRVRALLDDHARLAAECEALTSPFDADGGVDEAAWSRLTAFAEHLRRHEAAESMVIIEAREMVGV